MHPQESHTRTDGGNLDPSEFYYRGSGPALKRLVAAFDAEIAQWPAEEAWEERPTLAAFSGFLKGLRQGLADELAIAEEEDGPASSDPLN
jgi:hypothetical protein